MRSYLLFDKYEPSFFQISAFALFVFLFFFFFKSKPSTINKKKSKELKISVYFALVE